MRIPKKEVSLALGSYVTRASSDGEDYIITVEKHAPAGESGGQ